MHRKFIISIEPIEINAPAQTVWDILVDFKKYPEWNAFSIKAEATFKIGEPVVLYIARDNGKVMKNNFVLEVFEPPHELAWRLPKIIHKRLFNAYREQTVSSIDDNRCTYTTRDTFAGWIAGSIYKSQGAWVKDNFQKVGASLKARAEAMVT